MEYNEYLGLSHVRVGDDGSDCSILNTKVKDSIIEGGIHQFDQIGSGQYMSVRRDGRDQFNGSKYMTNGIRVYQTPNLLQVFPVTLTSDTSIGVAGYEAANLIQNFENRSCGNDR